MKLTILGSGTAVPRLNRNMSGYLLESENQKILFDSGPGTIRQLLKLKINLLDINHIFYTHFHNDHINDLPAIIWCNNYGTLRKKPLSLYGPKGFIKYFNILMKQILKPPTLNYKIEVKEMTKQSINSINNILIKSIKSKHTENSISYRIEHKNKSIVYSGDSDYSNNIIEISKNADLLILECSFPDNNKAKGHLIPSLCGKIATKAHVKKLVLTHFYPECELVDIKKQCSKEYSGNIFLAKDFMRFEL